jgi:hypothetical protein
VRACREGRLARSSGLQWRACSLSARVGKRAHVWTSQHKRRGEAIATPSPIALGGRKTTRAFFKRCARKRTVVLLVTSAWRGRSRRTCFYQPAGGAFIIFTYSSSSITSSRCWGLSYPIESPSKPTLRFDGHGPKKAIERVPSVNGGVATLFNLFLLETSGIQRQWAASRSGSPFVELNISQSVDRSPSLGRWMDEDDGRHCCLLIHSTAVLYSNMARELKWDDDITGGATPPRWRQQRFYCSLVGLGLSTTRAGPTASGQERQQFHYPLNHRQVKSKVSIETSGFNIWNHSNLWHQSITTFNIFI